MTRKLAFLFLPLLLILTIYFVPSFVMAHGGDINKIHGCIMPITKLLRIVKAKENCLPRETAIDWDLKATAAATPVPTPSITPAPTATGLPFICPRCFLEEIPHLTGKNLTSAWLREATTKTGNFSNINFTNADLAFLRGDDTNFSNSNFTNANLEGTAGVGLVRANFTNANLTNANLSNTNCKDAVMSNADLLKTNLTNADLTNANLSGAKNGNTANILGTIWNNTTCPDGTNSDVNGNTCVGHF